jgi:hypothetical protein
MQLHVQRNQQENKLKMLPHLLFYRNVLLSLILHIYIYLLYTVILLIAYQSKNLLLIINPLFSMVKPILPLILGKLSHTITENVQNRTIFFKVNDDTVAVKLTFCLTFHRKICLPVASRVALKLVNYPFLRM